MPPSPSSAHAEYSSSATRRGECPSDSSRWWMCARSALKIGCPRRNRRATASVVSSTGRPNDTIGIATAITVGDFCEPSSPMPGEHEAEEQTPRIAEEDRRGVEVEAEESDRRAGENDRHGRRPNEPIVARDDEHRRQREQRRAGGETIEPVDQVERVRDADEPHDGEQHPDDAAEVHDARRTAARAS